MTTAAAAVAAVLDALLPIAGLRPAGTAGDTPRRWPWDARAAAVDLSPVRVEVRLIASALPLPPLLDKAAVAVRGALDGTEWSTVPLRLIVTELDAAVFATKAESGSRPAGSRGDVT